MLFDEAPFPQVELSPRHSGGILSSNTLTDGIKNKTHIAFVRQWIYNKPMMKSSMYFTLWVPTNATGAAKLNT
jgi:hypothetical protein